MNFGKGPAQGTLDLILVTAIITTLVVGVFGKKVAETVLSILLKPLRLICDRIYYYLAPRNPLSISLRTYRKHVLRSELTRMENPVGPSLEVPLEYAFAPLKLRYAKSQESIDLFAYAAASGRCMVLGGPGTGKTTLMKSLVTSIVEKECRPELDNTIPVFVTLRTLAKKQHTVEQAIVSALADYHFPGADNFVSSALAAGRMVIVLDGLDEVGSNREFVAGQIHDFCQFDTQRERRNRIFVTCREHSYRTLDLHDVLPEILQVEPFANHHMRVFLEGWPPHKGRSAIRLYALIQGDPQIRDICRNPLLLTILTGLFLDSDAFELPSSRDLFYQNGIDELLVRRPARRQMKQDFNANAKRQILERVSLERLETVASDEDPEELTSEAMQRAADKVLGSGKVEVSKLLAELVEVNGIIKPTSEDTFTCAHRTIQEYLAAREARRSRETREVVETFGDRMVEVLYFYCALLDNLPALRGILRSLAEGGRYLEAGRALLHMKELPDESLVKEVSSELSRRILAQVEAEAALEVLSSLGNRRDPGFEIARSLFAEAIDRLAGGSERGASALETAISTSPEIAMALIPGMLKHPSERWKAAGVQLLRDIGTDEALDQLVQLLVDGDPYVRSRAGKVLAGFLRVRTSELRLRAALLPQRRDKAIWPLEAYFPGTIAIPIAESLASVSEQSESNAISCAIRALGAQKSGDKVFLRRWRRVPSDLAIRGHVRRCGVLMRRMALPLALAFIAVVTSSITTGYFTGQVLVLTATSPRVTMVPVRYIRAVSGHAEALEGMISSLYPPERLGLARILPWNWRSSPSLSGEAKKDFLKLKKCNDDPIGFILQNPHSAEFTSLMSNQEASELENAVTTLRRNLAVVRSDKYTIWVDVPSIAQQLLGFLWLALLLSAFMTKIMARNLLFRDSVALQLTFVATLLLGGSLLSKVALLDIIAVCVFLGIVVSKSNWPKNALLSSVDEFRPADRDWRFT